LQILPQTSQYILPLKANEISNFDNFSKLISLTNNSINLLEKNGFVIIKNPMNPKEEDITKAYDDLRSLGVPIFITSDSLLHIFHIQLDQTLKNIEERELYWALYDISKEFLNESIKDYCNVANNNELREAAKLNVTYFAIGLSLLQPSMEHLCHSNYELKTANCVPNATSKKKDDLEKSAFELFHLIRDNMIQELDLINKHAGFSKSPIFNYEVDYSQYLPRGHYTNNEKLQNYFKASIWYGTMNFLLKDKIQTIAAILIASKFSKNDKLRNKWTKIYSITAFYSGFSEGLGPFEYIKASNNIFKEADFIYSSYLTKQESIFKIKAELVEFISSKRSDLVGKDCLGPANGMCLMGQRFVPDSHVFNTLTGHNFTYKGNDKETTPFTMVHTKTGNTIRGFPRGLDVMATMLDSKIATEILCTLGDSNYKDYELSSTKLKQRFNTLDLKDWNRNLYWSWFYLLKTLAKEYGIGYPTFMKSKPWQHKMLTTSLASWSQLKHDTILYAKQSFTIGVTNIISSKRLFQSTLGYIEPVPDFYQRMRALAKMISNGLSQMNVLDEESEISLQNLESLLTEIISISAKELENKELSEKEYDFINNFPMLLNAIVDKVEDKSKKTTIISDVHTDRNSEKVLEEATGHVKLIVVAFKLSNERILLGVGPVLSYFEFKQPIKSRLTDETWRELLSSEGAPKEPKWIYSFTDPRCY
jgi:hypothetical protein